MLTNIREQRLLVVSDTHLGNPLFKSRKRFVEFLRYAWTNSWNVCINGDGVDIMQTTIARITRDLSECSVQLRRFGERGLRVYYTVGNHDIVLENFLDDWKIVCVVPFLNVRSGNRRIRVEHGHLYDGSYVHYPTIFHLATRLGGLALRIHPRCYQMVEHWKPLAEKTGRLFKKNADTDPFDASEEAESITGEPAWYRPRAEEIARHGFDAVIFGHTHREGQIRLSTGATYINTGSWLFEPHYAEIDHGQVTLKRVRTLDGMA